MLRNSISRNIALFFRLVGTVGLRLPENTSRRLLVTAILSCFVFSAPITAAQNSQSVELFEFDSIKQQKEAIALAKTLRCPMCQNQNLIESNSPVAKDIRLRVFELIKQGKTNQEVKQYMVERYGQHVLYQPALSRQNMLLWGLPIAVAFLLIVSMFYRVLRPR